MREGGCLCGFVRYRAGGTPSHETWCHCSICRRASGAPCVAWFSVDAAEFAFTAGAPATYRSSKNGTRAFCPRCGTQLTFRFDDLPGEVDVTTASLDDPEALPPRDHTRTSSRLSWADPGAELPSFAESRSDG